MAGFDDLLALGQPYVHTEERAVTAGTSWTWGYTAYDDSNQVVDLQDGFTGEYTVRSSAGALVIDVPVTFPAAGKIACAADPELTAAVLAGSHIQRLAVTRDSDDAILLVIGGESTFVVLPEGS
jgi:hypothetical protein